MNTEIIAGGLSEGALQQELAVRFHHADNLMHQRYAFWLVAEAALLAATAQAIGVSAAVAMFATFGLAVTLASTLSFWVIAERVDFALEELKTRSTPFRSFIESVHKSFPSGTMLLHCVLPTLWGWVWISIAVSQAIAVW